VFVTTAISTLVYYLGTRLEPTQVEHLIGLFHPLDGITNPKDMSLRFLTTKFLAKKEGINF
jgi:hypothetical protein